MSFLGPFENVKEGPVSDLNCTEFLTPTQRIEVVVRVFPGHNPTEAEIQQVERQIVAGHLVQPAPETLRKMALDLLESIQRNAWRFTIYEDGPAIIVQASHNGQWPVLLHFENCTDQQAWRRIERWLRSKQWSILDVHDVDHPEREFEVLT